MAGRQGNANATRQKLLEQRAAVVVAEVAAAAAAAAEGRVAGVAAEQGGAAAPVAVLPLAAQWQFTVNGAPVGYTTRYNYLGYEMTEDLDTTVTLQSRLRGAHLHALRMRSLPHGSGGLSLPLLSAVYGSMVQSHMEYGAGVWGPVREGKYALGRYTPPERSGARVNNPFVAAAKLQMWTASHLLGQCGGLAARPSAALQLAELGWLHVASRWELARLRMLGNILRSQQGSIVRAVAASLAAVHGNAPAPWNWVTNTVKLIKRIDEEVPANLQLGSVFNAASMLLQQDGPLQLHRGVGDFNKSWRGRCYEAVAGPDGCDAAAWREELKNKGAVRPNYPPASRRLPEVPPAAVVAVLAAAASAEGGGAHPFDGPPTCGTTSTIMALTRFKGGQEFGKQCMAPYLRSSFPNTATFARAALRVGITPSQVKPAEVAAVVGPAREVLPGGYLWGERVCQSCMGEASLDAWHRVSECPAFDAARVKGFERARRLLTVWCREATERRGQEERLLQALREAELARNTRVGRTLVFWPPLLPRDRKERET
jgi:hypothetical protein